MELLQIIAVFCMVSHISWGHGGGQGKPLEFSSEVHNKDHIIEHFQHQISTKPKDQMTDEELEFYYFKLHDYDNNNRLDGVEIGKALTHFHDDSANNSTNSEENKAESPNSEGKKAESPVWADEKLTQTIEQVLSMYDTDNDGYVEYFEFKSRSGMHEKPKE